MTRRQFVLDNRSNKLLEQLAADRGGNRSQVIREAIQVYAEQEEYLDKIEADPAFQKMMAQSEADIRAGRIFTHEQVLRASRKLLRKRRK
jgi:predicted transcriptional regulator